MNAERWREFAEQLRAGRERYRAAYDAAEQRKRATRLTDLPPSGGYDLLAASPVNVSVFGTAFVGGGTRTLSTPPDAAPTGGHRRRPRPQRRRG